MKIYLDNCCYNRPFDDLRQDRIRIEAESILSILRMAEIKSWEIIGSDILDVEMSKMKNKEQRKKVETLYHIIKFKISYSEEIKQLSDKIRKMTNIKLYDSLHLASAILAKADVFLTTDDKFEKACWNLSLNIRVINPVTWFMEVIK